MVKLYGAGPIWDLTDNSPFVMKVDIYLRMAKIPYTYVQSLSALSDSPKNKVPYIEHNGKKLSDSTFIIEYLEESFSVNLDRCLSASDKAVSLAFQRLIEENLYWSGIIFDRWVVKYEEYALGMLGKSLGIGADAMNPLRDIIVSQLKGQGMGRHTPEEIRTIAFKDLAALSAFLGDKPFFMGAEPTNLDACAFAFLANMLWVKYDSPVKDRGRTHQNLVDYCERMRERYLKQ